MRVRRADLFLIALPLRLTVRHALAARRVSRTLLVRLVDDDGREGWGEGVPREYVTGEDPERSFAHLAGEVLPALLGAGCAGAEELPPLLARLLAPLPGAQSCCCAAELALLDLAGTAFGRSAAAWFGGPRRGSVRYTMVLPLLEPPARSALLATARQLGVRHLKIKAEGERWPEDLAEARSVLGPDVTIAVDANGSWDAAAAAAALRRMEPHRVAWVEQPLPRGQEREIPRLAAQSPIPLMADESLTTLEEAQRLVRLGGYGLFNLRLSKLGGLAATHRVARLAADSGLRVQVGCQVGESSVLSAAGRLLAATLPGFEALEGSFGARLLESDVTAEPYEFGPGGEARVQEGPGLGVTVDPARLAPLVLRSLALP
jgi:muconate cycloisomerase